MALAFYGASSNNSDEDSSSDLLDADLIDINNDSYIELPPSNPQYIKVPSEVPSTAGLSPEVSPKHQSLYSFGFPSTNNNDSNNNINGTISMSRESSKSPPPDKITKHHGPNFELGISQQFNIEPSMIIEEEKEMVYEDDSDDDLNDIDGCIIKYQKKISKLNDENNILNNKYKKLENNIENKYIDILNEYDIKINDINNELNEHNKILNNKLNEFNKIESEIEYEQKMETQAILNMSDKSKIHRQQNSFFIMDSFVANIELDNQLKQLNDDILILKTDKYNLINSTTKELNNLRNIIKILSNYENRHKQSLNKASKEIVDSKRNSIS